LSLEEAYHLSLEVQDKLTRMKQKIKEMKGYEVKISIGEHSHEEWRMSNDSSLLNVKWDKNVGDVHMEVDIMK
jgi:hypothetical protein